MQPGRLTGTWHRTSVPPRHRQFTCQRNRGIGLVNFPVLRIFAHLVIIRRTCGHAAKPGRRSLELMLARAAGRQDHGMAAGRTGGDEAGARCATLIPARHGLSGRAMGDWLSGRAPRSHRGGHWFDPSIAHEPARAGRWPAATFRAGRSIFPGPEAPGPPRRGLRAAVSFRGVVRGTVPGRAAAWIAAARPARDAQPGSHAGRGQLPSAAGLTYSANAAASPKVE